MARRINSTDIWLIDSMERVDSLMERMEMARQLIGKEAPAEAKNGNYDTEYWSRYVNMGYPADVFSMNDKDRFGIISVNDELFDLPSWFGTDYRTLSRALENLEENPKCDFIILSINSPGGMMSGLFEFCNEIRNCSKPVYAYVGNWACSAAYAIAVSCKAIYATPSSEVGSVGAIYHITDMSQYYKKLGIEEITIAAKNSEKKHLNVNSEEGRKTLQARIDKAEGFLIDHISKCRGVTPDDVLASFGHGDVFYSSDAIDRGMVDYLVAGLDECVDKIKNPGSAATESASLEADKGNREVSLMTVEELKAQYPDLCEQLEASASAEAVETARADEQSRVDEAVAAELSRRKEIEAYASVDDAEFKAFVEKAIEDKTSVADFKVEAAGMLLTIMGKQKAKAVAQQGDKDDVNDEIDEYFKGEAEETAKMAVETKGREQNAKEDVDAFYDSEIGKLSFEE